MSQCKSLWWYWQFVLRWILLLCEIKPWAMFLYFYRRNTALRKLWFDLSVVILSRTAPPFSIMNRFYGGGGGSPGLGFNQQHFNRFHSPRQVSNISNNTNSNDQQARESRLFCGNLNPEFVCQQELEEIFCRHGTLLGISLHKGYAFIQFSNKEEARKAARLEQGRILSSQPLGKYSKVMLYLTDSPCLLHHLMPSMSGSCDFM